MIRKDKYKEIRIRIRKNQKNAIKKSNGEVTLNNNEFINEIED